MVGIWDTLKGHGIEGMSQLMQKSHNQLSALIESLSPNSLRDLNVELWKVDEDQGSVIATDAVGAFIASKQQGACKSESEQTLTRQWLISTIEEKLDEITKNGAKAANGHYKYEEENKLDNPQHEQRQEFLDEGFQQNNIMFEDVEIGGDYMNQIDQQNNYSMDQIEYDKPPEKFRAKLYQLDGEGRWNDLGTGYFSIDHVVEPDQQEGCYKMTL